jgi:hypothetical protein
MISLTIDRDRRPSITDYMAAAVLAYGIVYFWIELNALYDPPLFLGYLIYYLGGLIPSYLVCRRTGSAELAIGAKNSVASWGFVVVSVTTFTEGNTLTFFALLLIMFLLGGLTAAYLTLRRRLKPAKQGKPDSTQDNTLNQPKP